MLCHIQDTKHLKMICLDEQINGVYQLKMDTKPTHLHKTVISRTRNNVDSFDIIPCNFSIHMPSLWHFRSCHLSSQIMAYMTHLYPSIIYNKTNICDIYHFS